MPTFAVSLVVDTSTVERALALLVDAGQDAPTFPETAKVVGALARAGRAMWRAYAGGSEMPNGQKIGYVTGGYQRSIQMEQEDSYHAEVFSDHPAAATIEEGCGPYDMKQYLETSVKVRVGKRGQRILIIPFRHGMAGTLARNRPMPRAIYDVASKLAPSRVMGRRREPILKSQLPARPGTAAERYLATLPKGAAPYVDRNVYRWGGRMSEALLRVTGASEAEVRRYRGMVRMNGAGHTAYLTFRAMSDLSPAGSWIRPAREGKHPAAQVAAHLQKVGQERLEAAFRADLQAMA